MKVQFAAARVGSALLLIVTATSAWAAGDAERGRVVFALAAGCGCHTPAQGPVGAGGGEVPTPFGTFYGTNLTPDRDSGIGEWTNDQIRDAIRAGVRPDGSTESPAMPYYHYAGMSDADVADLIAFLRSLPAVSRANQPHTGELPLARWAYRAWRALFVTAAPPAASSPTASVERGRYLVDHVSICGDCHTPRTRFGAPDRGQYLAGTKQGPGGKPVPNITPHRTGIADWDAADVVSLLELGMLPNFDNVQGYMAEVIDGHGGGPGYKDAPAADRAAIAAYLKTVPPIDNLIGDD